MIWAVGHRLAPQALKRIERSMGTSNANCDTWRAKAAISAVSALESGHSITAHYATGARKVFAEFLRHLPMG